MAPSARHTAAQPGRRAPSWLLAARTVAAYRDRWNITTPQPLDTPGSARTIEQASQQHRAASAAARALRIARQAADQHTLAHSPTVELERDRPTRDLGPER